MPGIIDIYTGFADNHVELLLKENRVNEVSRAKVELQLLNEVDKAQMPIEHKLGWYQAVLASSKFDPFWISTSTRHGLPESCTARYVSDQTLLDFEAPSEDEIEEGSLADAEGGSEDEVFHGDRETFEEEVCIQDEDTHDDATVGKFVTPSMVETPARPLSPDSSDWEDSSSSDEDREEREPDPRAYVRIKRSILRCDRCNAYGHAGRLCPTLRPDPKEYNWADHESDSSCGSFGKHKAKVRAKVLFMGLEQRPEEAVHDWVQRQASIWEEPCSAWSDMNPQAREQADGGAYENSPHGCKCRRKVEAELVNDSSRESDNTWENSRAALGHTDVARVEDDGAYEEVPSTSKVGGSVAATSIRKTAARPQGVTKKKPAPLKIQKTPAHLKGLFQAATASAQASDEPTARTQGYVSPPLGKGQKAKRALEQVSNDDEEEDAPAAKKAKNRGAAC